MRRSLPAGLMVIPLSLLAMGGQSEAATSDYVIHISVDGLGGHYLRSLLSTPQSPGGSYYNFSRFVNEGAYTFNARNDYDYTVTLPNHTSQLTGRPVLGTGAHNVTFNDDNGSTLKATNGGTYINGVFDTVHNAGRSTGFYSTKDKFNYLIRSWGTAGEPTSKLDQVTNLTTGSTRSSTMIADFVSDMGSAATRSNYSFVHFHDPDTAGHDSGWGGTAYNTSIANVNTYLGQIFSLVESNAALQNKTTILLTADHGGVGTNHAANNDANDYVIPLFAWGAGVTEGTDLYRLNRATRSDPGTSRPTVAASAQPIRAGEISNLGLSLLGLGSISGSSLNSTQTLTVAGLKQSTIARADFSEPTVGSTNFTPTGSQEELGFTTTSSIPAGAGSTFVGTRSSGSSLYTPVLTHQSRNATTVFDSVDLSGVSNAIVSLDIRIDATTYEAGDFIKVTVSNGVQTLTVVDLQGTNSTDLLDQLANGTNGGYLNYSLEIPESWSIATLKIQSFGNSSTGAERYDFDNILFTAAVPEPSAMALVGIGALALLRRRRRVI